MPYQFISTHNSKIDYPCDLKLGLSIFNHYLSIYETILKKKFECHFKLFLMNDIIPYLYLI